jgi:Spy/CpxP family protein refolding chaperone
MTTTPSSETSKNVTKMPKAKQTIEQQIEALEAKTRKLKEQLKEDQRRERERNAKAVHELLKGEKLEDFGIEAWRAQIAEIRKLLESAKI